MRLVDVSLETPALNLALDELLLDRVEMGTWENTLRFWESAVPFVVLGTAQILHDEVFEDRCNTDAMPILRRCSAGGCVLQGPGCLNFSLALTVHRFPEIASLHESYRFILGQVIEALRPFGIVLNREGVSDLTLEGRKVSGNAQRRRRRAILHHGTMLHAPDIDGMRRYLKEPSQRPAYRGLRNHERFVTGLPLSPSAVRAALQGVFAPDAVAKPLDASDLAACRTLASSKYERDEWTRRR